MTLRLPRLHGRDGSQPADGAGRQGVCGRGYAVGQRFAERGDADLEAVARTEELDALEVVDSWFSRLWAQDSGLGARPPGKPGGERDV